MKLLEKRAKKELKKFIKYANSQQLKNIKQKFEKEFDPDLPEACIYGLATRDCNNEEAIKLIKKCCRKENYTHESSDNVIPRTCFWLSDLEEFIYTEEYPHKSFEDSKEWVRKHLISKI